MRERDAVGRKARDAFAPMSWRDTRMVDLAPRVGLLLEQVLGGGIDETSPVSPKGRSSRRGSGRHGDAGRADRLAVNVAEELVFQGARERFISGRSSLVGVLGIG